MDAWLSTHPIPAFAIILGLFLLLCKVLDKMWPIIWKQTSNEGLVSKAELKECLDRLACELDAGDERMDTGAEVGVFVATWFPVMCKALRVPDLDCKTMEEQAADLLRKLIFTGRDKRGGNHAH